MLSLVYYLCVFFPLLGFEFLSFFKNLCDQIKKSSKWHLKCLMLSVFFPTGKSREIIHQQHNKKHKNTHPNDSTVIYSTPLYVTIAHSQIHLQNINK